MENLTYLLSQADPWIRYRTLLDLAGRQADDPQVLAARAEMLAHPLIRNLLAELQAWPGIVLNSHKSAGQLYHKLAFLADLGLTGQDDALATVLNSIVAHLSDEGLPQLSTNVPVHFGGDGLDHWAWALCDTPLQLYALIRMGWGDQPEIRTGLAYLLDLVRKNGWPCTVSKELGSFRGPGRKDDPCPYATLLMTQLLLQLPEWRESPHCRTGVETLLGLWQDSWTAHPYMFFMGTDFRKLKAPFIWYDILHVADVLSQSAWALSDARFADMLAVINAKVGQDGLFTPESEWKAWNGWEFSQKKHPSAWMTFLVDRINRRFEDKPAQ